MLDRTKQPEIKEIEKVDFLKPKVLPISEYTELYHISAVPNETCRLDLHFQAGSVTGKGIIPGTVNGLLLSGTNEKSAIKIASEIDALGGFFNSSASLEYAVLTIYCLRENLIPLFDIVMDAIQNVAFHEKEVKEYLSDKKQRFKINMGKVSFLAQMEYRKRIFSTHPDYAKTASLEDYDNVSIEDLQAFHQKHYLKGLSHVSLVGDVGDQELAHIIDAVKNMSRDQKIEFEKTIKNERGVFHVKKEGALQNAIRIGRTIFTKKHKDFIDFTILNTVLGDYFGSRLMSNIREDKGYTYGIGSFVMELKNTGYFTIGTEVRADVKDATIKEIKKEIERLQIELVSKEELDLVKNYIVGQVLKDSDGPFSQMDAFLNVRLQDMDLDFYNKAIQRTKEIKPEKIQEVARKYLNWEEMTIVSAG